MESSYPTRPVMPIWEYAQLHYEWVTQWQIDGIWVDNRLPSTMEAMRGRVSMPPKRDLYLGILLTGSGGRELGAAKDLSEVAMLDAVGAEGWEAFTRWQSVGNIPHVVYVLKRVRV